MTGNSRRTARSRAKPASEADDDREVRGATPSAKVRRRGREPSSIRILDVNLKFLLGFGVISFSIALFVIYRLVNPAEVPQIPRVITPLPAPKLADLPMVMLSYLSGFAFEYTFSLRFLNCEFLNSL